MNLKDAQLWLINDQYPHGEWGKHEITNPTDTIRTFETSLMKPNIFSSSHAYYTLKVTGFNEVNFENNFFLWLHNIRNSEGFWTSATGAKIPFGIDKGFSDALNIRHTAKGLDLLFLKKDFISSDSALFSKIISYQHYDGSFPQYESGHADLWSTAYVTNLLLRALHLENIKLTVPRNYPRVEWENHLRNKLEKAVIWLLDSRGRKGLWEINGQDPYRISEAVLLEIGSYLGFSNRDICVILSDLMLSDSNKNRAAIIWNMLLMFNCLRKDQQQETIDRLYSIEFSDNSFQDIIEATSVCKLLWLKDRYPVVEYYKFISCGHESLMLDNNSWSYNKYFLWCLDQPTLKSQIVNPLNKSDSWNNLIILLGHFKKELEFNRGWELLWDSKSESRNEKLVQSAFFNIVRSLCDKNEILIREPETGRGPVDFIYSNKFHEKILLEFKLATNNKLRKGFINQIVEYLKGSNLDSAYIVVVGFSDEEEKVMVTVNSMINSFMNQNSEYFITSIFVNAKRRPGASLD